MHMLGTVVGVYAWLRTMDKPTVRAAMALIGSALCSIAHAQAPLGSIMHQSASYSGSFSVQFVGVPPCGGSDAFQLSASGAGQPSLTWSQFPDHIPIACGRAGAGISQGQGVTARALSLLVSGQVSCGFPFATASMTTAALSGSGSAEFTLHRVFQASTGTGWSFGCTPIYASFGQGTGIASGTARLWGPIGAPGQQAFALDEEFSAINAANGFSLSVSLAGRIIAPGTYRIQYSLSGEDYSEPTQYARVSGGSNLYLVASEASVVWPLAMDVNGDGQVTLADLLAWLAAPRDTNGDGTLDTEPYGDDAATLAAILAGQGNLGEDCNTNGFPDAYDVAVTGSPACLPCGTSDFDNDGDSGTDSDIEAFFACLSGNCCPTCFAGGSDFDADGDAGTDSDIEAFFRVLAGGSC